MEEMGCGGTSSLAPTQPWHKKPSWSISCHSVPAPGWLSSWHQEEEPPSEWSPTGRGLEELGSAWDQPLAMVLISDGKWAAGLSARLQGGCPCLRRRTLALLRLWCPGTRKSHPVGCTFVECKPLNSQHRLCILYRETSRNYRAYFAYIKFTHDLISGCNNQWFRALGYFIFAFLGVYVGLFFLFSSLPPPFPPSLSSCFVQHVTKLHRTSLGRPPAPLLCPEPPSTPLWRREGDACSSRLNQQRTFCSHVISFGFVPSTVTFGGSFPVPKELTLQQRFQCEETFTGVLFHLISTDDPCGGIGGAFT